MAKTIKVLMLAPTTVVGGITTWLRVLLKYSDTKSISYQIIDTSKLYDPLGKKPNIRSHFFGVYHSILRLKKIFASVFTDRPDLVYLTCAPGLGFIIRDSAYLFLLSLLRIPTVVHLHGGNVDGFFGSSPLLQLIVRSALRSCAKILVITREVEERGIDIFGNKKVVYVPNMYDDDVFYRQVAKNSRGNESPTTLLHVGWQAPEKGSFDLVEAMQFIKSDVFCGLVGNASQANELAIRQLILENNVTGKIDLCGLKAGEDLSQMYEKADIFVFPTHREGPEGFPMVILEAMSYGVPIIANNVGNIKEMLGVDTDDPAGILLSQVDPVDPKEIARQVDLLINDPNLRTKFSVAGRNRVEFNYLASRVVPDLENLLHDVVRTKSSLNAH